MNVEESYQVSWLNI